MVGKVIKNIVKKLVYYLWVLYGFWGWKYGLRSPEKASVLITYYNPIRIKHINHQIRNLLKCKFVERIIISNHNPEIKIENFVRVIDERLVFLNQGVRRGCGYRWLVAAGYSPEYLIVIDDDILLFPSQLQKLFRSLISEPDIPHGFAGMIRQPNGDLNYYQKVERRVDFICEIYAITGKHLQKYIQTRDLIVADEDVAKSVEQTADFVVVSGTGLARPKIHFTWHLLRCPTFNQSGIAVHKEPTYMDDIRAVLVALDAVSQ
jgi:hypothetical protein